MWIIHVLVVVNVKIRSSSLVALPVVRDNGLGYNSNSYVNNTLVDRYFNQSSVRLYSGQYILKRAWILLCQRPATSWSKLAYSPFSFHKIYYWTISVNLAVTCSTDPLHMTFDPGFFLDLQYLNFKKKKKCRINRNGFIV
jgi:hypothetical protein